MSNVEPMTELLHPSTVACCVGRPCSPNDRLIHKEERKLGRKEEWLTLEFSAGGSQRPATFLHGNMHFVYLAEQFNR